MSYYYTRDHLFSVREMCNSSGTIVARYSYDPYGLATLVGGTNLATFQYTGDYTHQPSGLNLTKYRAYDPNTGRWLSRDPIGENGGINLYDYVKNRPLDLLDILGLACVPLPDSGPGSFHSNILDHNFGGGPASSLTFNVCCPAAYPHLTNWGVSVVFHFDIVRDFQIEVVRKRGRFPRCHRKVGREGGFTMRKWQRGLCPRTPRIF